MIGSAPDNDNPNDIAYELYVDTLDLRVYSGRKGRMWQTPNVKRESGKYNVGANCGEAAGQSVWHAHVPVIPRYKGDVPDPKGGVRHVIPLKGFY